MLAGLESSFAVTDSIIGSAQVKYFWRTGIGALGSEAGLPSLSAAACRVDSTWSQAENAPLLRQHMLVAVLTAGSREQESRKQVTRITLWTSAFVPIVPNL